MSLEFFGQFLVHRGTITQAQLLEALQDQNNRNLAGLAVAKGMILREEAGDLLARHPTAGMDFGGTAVKNKLLSQEQLDFLHFLLKSDVRGLCSVLTEKKFVSADELVFLTDEYTERQKQFAIRPHRLPPSLTGRADLVALLSMLENHLSKFGIAPVQLSEPQPYSGRIGLRDVTVRLKIEGDATGFFVLSFDRALAVLIAGQMLGASNLDSDDLLGDAVGEFSNLVAGSAAAQLSATGHHLSFSAPEHLPANAPFGLTFDAGIWELQTPWGGAHLVAE